ncbi:MAG: hypothetical protein QOF14_2925 [Hyphomicrobiales bacterium]|jgi:hypothetical protein|nr:hypothetical protein [Hyphomicrobiales bacterium]
MSKDDEYRRRAAEAQTMADKVVSDTDKAAWLQVAHGWLALIRQPRQSASDKFDAAESNQGTHQTKSDAEH